MGGDGQNLQPEAGPSPLPSPPYQPPVERFENPLGYMHMPMEAFEKTITAMVPRSLDELQSVLNQMMGGAGDRGGYAQDVLKGAIGMKQNLQTLTQEPVGTQRWWDAAVPTGLAAAGEFAPMVPKMARGSAITRNPIVQEARKVQETLGPQREMTAGELDAVHRMMTEMDNPPPLEVTPEPVRKDVPQAGSWNAKARAFGEAFPPKDWEQLSPQRQAQVGEEYRAHLADIKAAEEAGYMEFPKSASEWGSAMRSGGKEPPPPGAGAEVVIPPRFRVVGSRGRGTHKPTSDYDIVTELSPEEYQYWVTTPEGEYPRLPKDVTDAAQAGHDTFIQVGNKAYKVEPHPVDEGQFVVERVSQNEQAILSGAARP